MNFIIIIIIIIISRYAAILRTQTRHLSRMQIGRIMSVSDLSSFLLLQVRKIGFPLLSLRSLSFNETCHNQVLQLLFPDNMTKEPHLHADNIIEQFVSIFPLYKTSLFVTLSVIFAFVSETTSLLLLAGSLYHHSVSNVDHT